MILILNYRWMKQYTVYYDVLWINIENHIWYRISKNIMLHNNEYLKYNNRVVYLIRSHNVLST